MNKSELKEKLSIERGITIKQAEVAVNSLFEVMTETLSRAGRIEIRGFGSFKVKEYDGFKGRNPKTGELVDVSPKKLPFFKVGKDLHERLNDSHGDD